jgi:hypothetical protein
LCDDEELNDTFFSWNNFTEMRDEFDAKIMKVKDEARL